MFDFAVSQVTSSTSLSLSPPTPCFIRSWDKNKQQEQISSRGRRTGPHLLAEQYVDEARWEGVGFAHRGVWVRWWQDGVWARWWQEGSWSSVLEIVQYVHLQPPKCCVVDLNSCPQKYTAFQLRIKHTRDMLSPIDANSPDRISSPDDSTKGDYSDASMPRHISSFQTALASRGPIVSASFHVEQSNLSLWTQDLFMNSPLASDPRPREPILVHADRSTAHQGSRCSLHVFETSMATPRRWAPIGGKKETIMLVWQEARLRKHALSTTRRTGNAASTAGFDEGACKRRRITRRNGRAASHALSASAKRQDRRQGRTMNDWVMTILKSSADIQPRRVLVISCPVLSCPVPD
ncbi:unnamed protein product [Zymoseptoria tritici ST99CH_3D1]|nr:unnamed protein product [Zymoseptoria tritici ST99CH_3D1]